MNAPITILWVKVCWFSQMTVVPAFIDNGDGLNVNPCINTLLFWILDEVVEDDGKVMVGVGTFVGVIVGIFVGTFVGTLVGIFVGTLVGAFVNIVDIDDDIPDDKAVELSMTEDEV